MRNFTSDKEKLLLIYDGDCPVCRYYCEGLSVNSDACNLELMDFRRDGSWENNLGRSSDNNSTSDYNPDRAILFKRGAHVYQGGEALHQLNKISVHSGVLSRFFSLMFCRSGFSRAIYPAFRWVRDMWLKITKIIK